MRSCTVSLLLLQLLGSLLFVGLAHAADFTLLNETGQAKPVWTRTSPSSQPPPTYVPDYLLYDYAVTNGLNDATDPAPYLLWGNTFTVTNVRPQNDSIILHRKRLSPSYHFSMENQTIAMESQEYLIRPRGYYSFLPNGAKRARTDEQPFNGEFPLPYGESGANVIAALALTVTPKWAAFRLTNSSQPDVETVAFFNSETIQSGGATFNLWASNPSAMLWSGPDADNFNVSDPAQATINNPPMAYISIEWLVACRWIANGTDCGDDGVGASDICALVEDGLCWSRTHAPAADIESFYDGNRHVYPAPLGGPPRYDGFDWGGIAVVPRPLTLFNPSAEDFTFDGNGNPVNPSPQLDVDVRPNEDTPTFIIGLPLNDQPRTQEYPSSFTSTGSTTNNWLRRFMPGKDNAGGTLEITVRHVIEVPDIDLFPNRVSRYVDTVQMVPPKLVISKDQPTASLYFTNVTKPTGVSSYVVHFLVTETSPSTITIANSTSALGDLRGIYPNGAYAIGAIQLHLESYDIEIRNFPPEGDNGIRQLPIMSERLLDCSSTAPYVVQIATSADDLGAGSISLPFTVTPGGALRFWSCTNAAGKRQNAPVEINSFTFTGDTTVMEFLLSTSNTPVSSASMSFGTPVLGNAVLDPVNGFSFAQNGTYSFSITQNDIHLEVANELGLGDDQTGGPFTEQDFYMQLKWTPPTRNGFRIAVSGLYTTFPSSAVVSDNNTTGTFTVPPGASGYLAGPFRVSSPTNLLEVVPSFDVIYSLSLLPLESGLSDDTWYRLPSALQPITINRQRFDVVSPIWQIGDFRTVTLWATGVKTAPFCFGPAFPGAISVTEEVWLSLSTPQYPSAVIFEPVTPFAGVRPPNAVVLTAANPVACVTARYDINAHLGMEFFDGDLFRATVQMSGPSASGFTALTLNNMPQFLLTSGTLRPAWSPTASGNYQMGDPIQAWISIDVAPQRGLAYNLTAPGCTFTPLSPNAGFFTPTGPLQQLWQITVYELPMYHSPSDGTVLPYKPVSVLIMLSGEDAAFYEIAGNSRDLPPVYPRSVSTNLAAFETIDIAIGGLCCDGLAVRTTLGSPVLNSLTVTPYARSSGAPSGGVSFIPPSYTFTPNVTAVISFEMKGELLGDYNFTMVMSGPDAPIYRHELLTRSYVNDKYLPIRVRQRPAWTITNLPDTNFKAGVVYGPLVLSNEFGALPDEDVTITLDWGADWQLSQTVFNVAGQDRMLFSAKFVPQSVQHSLSTAWNVSMHMTGRDAWKYSPPRDLRLVVVPRDFEVRLAEMGEAVVGVRYTGSITYDGAPEGIRILISSPNVQFFLPGALTPSSSPSGIWLVQQPADTNERTTMYFEYIVRAPITSPSVQNGDADLLTNSDDTDTDIHVTYVLDADFAGNRYYSSPLAALPQTVTQTVRRRVFYFDTTNAGPKRLQNKQTLAEYHGYFSQVFMVNRESPLYTIFITAPPENTVTLTIQHPYLTFNGGQPSATLSFDSGRLSQSFTFVPTRMLPDSVVINHLQIHVSGPDAELYEFSDVYFKMSRLIILPELGFTPLPPMYPDETVEGLKVWLVDAIRQGFNFSSDWTDFTLQLNAEGQGAVAVPSVLEFTSKSMASNVLSQTYSIVNLRPSAIGDRGSLELLWGFRYNNRAYKFDISQYVPLDARRVIIKRHQILPHMPSKLNFEWQRASFNATRAPLSHMTFIPRIVNEDGTPPVSLGGKRDAPNVQPAYGGSRTAGGRIVFEPPQIVFRPGQDVVNFQIKAIAGSDQNAVYYRVDWEMVGSQNDLVNYIEYIQGDGHFHTWHRASASLATISSVVLLVSAIVIALFSL